MIDTLCKCCGGVAFRYAHRPKIGDLLLPEHAFTLDGTQPKEGDLVVCGSCQQGLGEDQFVPDGGFLTEFTALLDDIVAAARVVQARDDVTRVRQVADLLELRRLIEQLDAATRARSMRRFEFGDLRPQFEPGARFVEDGKDIGQIAEVQYIGPTNHTVVIVDTTA